MKRNFVIVFLSISVIFFVIAIAISAQPITKNIQYGSYAKNSTETLIFKSNGTVDYSIKQDIYSSSWTAEYSIKNGKLFINSNECTKYSAFSIIYGDTTLLNDMAIAGFSLCLIFGVIALLVPLIRYLVESRIKEKNRMATLEREVAELKASKKDE